MKKVFAPSSAKGRVLSRCANCRTLQMSPMPDREELAAYYQDYDVLGERDPYYRAAWNKEMAEGPEKEEAERHLSFLGPFIFSGARLLDVGSGSGLFLRLAVAAGLNAHGVELNREAARRSSEEFGLSVTAGSIVDAEDGYDAITLWDILEHVPDPGELIRECGRRLRQNGWLMIETPNEASLLDRAVNFLRRLGLKGPAETFYGMHHLVLLRPAVLRRLLEENGFSVERIQAATTDPARVFRGNGFKDKMMRLGVGFIQAAGKTFGRQNKMVVAARKK